MDSKTNWLKNARNYMGRLKGENWLLRHIEDIAPQSKILELGCGEGWDSAYLLNQGHKVLSTDLLQEHLNKTKQNIGESANSQLMLLDLTNGTDWKKVSDNSCDVVVASLCLHYFAQQQTEQILDEIKRVLKPNGKLLARVNSVNDLIHGANDGTEIGGESHFRQIKDGTKRFFDKQDIEKFFGKFGTVGTAVERQELYGIRQYKKILWEISATSNK